MLLVFCWSFGYCLLCQRRTLPRIPLVLARGRQFLFSFFFFSLAHVCVCCFPVPSHTNYDWMPARGIVKCVCALPSVEIVEATQGYLLYLLLEYKHFLHFSGLYLLQAIRVASLFHGILLNFPILLLFVPVFLLVFVALIMGRICCILAWSRDKTGLHCW